MLVVLFSYIFNYKGLFMRVLKSGAVVVVYSYSYEIIMDTRQVLNRRGQRLDDSHVETPFDTRRLVIMISSEKILSLWYLPYYVGMCAHTYLGMIPTLFVATKTKWCVR